MDFLRQADLTVGPLLATFLLGFATLLLYCWYSVQKQSYWKKIGIPYAKPVPFFGSILESVKLQMQGAELHRYQTLGRIYGHYEGNRAVLSVGEPEILRNILVKDFHAFTNRRSFSTGDKITEKMMSILQGEDWKRVRTIVTPTFTTGKIKRMLSIFKDSSKTLVKNFEKYAIKGEPVEVKRIYGTFTMDIIASSAFSTKIDSYNDPDNEFVLTARSAFSRNVSWRFGLFLLMPWFVRFFRIGVFPPKFQNFFKNITLQIIEERKRTGQTRNDFLQLLLDTAKETGLDDKEDQTEKDDIVENYGELENNDALKVNLSKKTLSYEEMIAQCVIFFFAGYDTTASTLSFASYLLCLNPDIQERLIQEVDEAFNANDGELTYEAVQNMKYLDNVISETLRLYPPAVRLERVADEDYKLGDTGLTVPKGMIITVPIYAIHRDPKLFPDPEKFDPDRFTPEERAKRDPYAYIPFGAGPRNCVGMRFALMEVKVCLAHVLRNFRIRRCSGTKVPLTFYNSQGLLQPKDVTVLMEVRKDNV